VVFNHFVNLLGQMQARSASLNWEDLFEEEEIKKVIVHMANEKAPGPNGFMDYFIKNVGKSSDQTFWQHLEHSTPYEPGS
jgi:ABC-type thiamine transport system substrate-binding protein